MNIVTISENYDISSYDLGVVGEHNATRLIITPPKELSQDSRTRAYRVTFKLRNIKEPVITEAYTTSPIVIDMPKNLTKCSSLAIQVVSYASTNADINNYIGLGKLLEGFKLAPSDYNNTLEEVEKSLDDVVLGLQKTLDSKVEKVAGKGLSTNDYTNADKQKLDGINLSLKADLVNGKVPESQLPSFVDDVLEGYYINPTTFEDENHLVYEPMSGKIYVDIPTGYTYRWSGTIYTQIGGGGFCVVIFTENSSTISSSVSITNIIASSDENRIVFGKLNNTTSGTKLIYTYGGKTGNNTVTFSYNSNGKVYEIIGTIISGVDTWTSHSYDISSKEDNEVAKVVTFFATHNDYKVSGQDAYLKDYTVASYSNWVSYFNSLNRDFSAYTLSRLFPVPYAQGKMAYVYNYSALSGIYFFLPKERKHGHLYFSGDISIAWLNEEDIWMDGATSRTATTATLYASSWTNNEIYIESTLFETDSIIEVCPAPTSTQAYVDARINCQDLPDGGALLFTCATVPTTDIRVNLMILRDTVTVPDIN